MTTYQKQCLLGYLGYNPGPIDGAAGPRTAAALAKFTEEYGSEELLLAAVAGTASKKEAVGKDINVPGKADQYLQADGCYHIPRGVDVQLTRNFWAHEIHCQGKGCCTESIISKRVMDTAQAIRDELGEPLTIATSGGSGYRCWQHNIAVLGASNSLHVSGNAVDLHYKSPARLKTVALHQVTDGEVGLYSWGCHVGVWDRGYVSQFNG